MLTLSPLVLYSELTRFVSYSYYMSPTLSCDFSVSVGFFFLIFQGFLSKPLAFSPLCYYFYFQAITSSVMHLFFYWDVCSITNGTLSLNSLLFSPLISHNTHSLLLLCGFQTEPCILLGSLHKCSLHCLFYFLHPVHPLFLPTLFPKPQVLPLLHLEIHCHYFSHFFPKESLILSSINLLFVFLHFLLKLP